MPSAGLYQWLLMDGYGWFVWPSYVLGLLVLLFNLAYPFYRHRRLSMQWRRRSGSRE